MLKGNGHLHWVGPGGALWGTRRTVLRSKKRLTMDRTYVNYILLTSQNVANVRLLKTVVHLCFQEYSMMYYKNISTLCYIMYWKNAYLGRYLQVLTVGNITFDYIFVVLMKIWFHPMKLFTWLYLYFKSQNLYMLQSICVTSHYA